TLLRISYLKVKRSYCNSSKSTI
ncbi:chain length determinant family protein, partial [Vibrio parahaemolyticus VPTS-2010_2]